MMKIERDQGLDTLKAISIILILFWHLQPVRFVTRNDNHTFIYFLNGLVEIFNWQLTLIAVPIFYIVSLYLFFQKIRNKNYLKKRLVKLCSIFIFWSVIQIVFATIINSKFPNLSWEMIIGIEPILPLVGDSVLYFLFNLIILIVFAYFYQSLNFNHKKLLSYIIVIFSLILFELTCLPKFSVPYYYLRNFLIYVPIAFALVNYTNKVVKFKFYYLATYILFSLHDICLRYYNYSPGIHSRISVVFGALTLFCFIHPLKIQGNWLTQKLAKYSLGLFVLHKYWQYLFILLIINYPVSINIGIPLNILFLTIDILVVCSTVLTIALLRLTNLKQFVS
ncbi:acyltransferase family protein [aff. Roholtiella sp. LEGE 12411]|uniref:acyltransferase family protein n=1 Tax=aff. Roholtiella sp. LEGE 12411 TaxID=1828822 RepID=UPI001881FB71|nr:acyltransferase family protein [aff. Roholtiella sp. LEGE 12411]MBE9034194.1 acyltransferase family protein [aff. Roholtiella sp. LEGE 12411]